MRPESVDFLDDSILWHTGWNESFIPYAHDFLSGALSAFLSQHQPVKGLGGRHFKWLDGELVFSFLLDYEPRSQMKPVMRGSGRIIGLMVLYIANVPMVDLGDANESDSGNLRYGNACVPVRPRSRERSRALDILANLLYRSRHPRRARSHGT